MNAWLVIVAVGAGSYLFRVSMVALVGRAGWSDRFDRASTFVVPSAFAALATSGIIAGLGGYGAGSIAPLAAVGVAVVAVRRTGSPHAAMVAGMPTLWILYALLPG
ncbi:MAG TPA: AzlD domain-containing protein [Acidimicrobiales bacterium]